MNPQRKIAAAPASLRCGDITTSRRSSPVDRAILYDYDQLRAPSGSKTKSATAAPQTIRVSIREIRVSEAPQRESESAARSQYRMRKGGSHGGRPVVARQSIHVAVSDPAWRVPRGSMRF